MIQVWVNKDDAANVAALSTKLNKWLEANAGACGNVIALDESKRAEFQKLADSEKIEKACLSVLPAGKKDEVAKSFKLNPEVKNTVIIYKGKKVAASLVDVAAADFEAKIGEAVKGL